MKTTTRTAKYVKVACGKYPLLSGWNMLSRERKKEAERLVVKYGYPVNIAIQQAYIFGRDRWPYDYRNKRVAGLED